MTTVQSICTKQAHVGKRDERMELMKGMVVDAMEAPMKKNLSDVEVRCLKMDVEKMEKEVKQLEKSLEDGMYCNIYAIYSLSCKLSQTKPIELLL